jgi:hypothetical protein
MTKIKWEMRAKDDSYTQTNGRPDDHMHNAATFIRLISHVSCSLAISSKPEISPAHQHTIKQRYSPQKQPITIPRRPAQHLYIRYIIGR